MRQVSISLSTRYLSQVYLLATLNVRFFHSFWRPITCPVRDWPLALCDPNTLNIRTELEPCDLVYPDYVVENQQVYFSDEQRWVYLSEQMPTEAWVFLQADTQLNGGNPVAHTAFPILGVQLDAVPPRESIEARALVFYAKVKD